MPNQTPKFVTLTSESGREIRVSAFAVKYYEEVDDKYTLYLNDGQIITVPKTNDNEIGINNID